MTDPEQRCTWTWSEGKYAGRQCNRPAIRDNRCKGCSEGKVPPGPRAIAGWDPLRAYLGHHSGSSVDQALQYLAANKLDRVALTSLIEHPVLPESPTLLRYLLDCFKSGQYAWADVAPAVSADFCRRLLRMGQLNLLGDVLASGLDLDHAALIDAYQTGLSTTSLIWLIEHVPAARMGEKTLRLLVHHLMRSNEVKDKVALTQRLVSQIDEFSPSTWEYLLEKMSWWKLTGRQCYLAPRWVHSRLATRDVGQMGQPTVQDKEIVAWCPDNAPPCTWACPGHCRRLPGARSEDLSRIGPEAKKVIIELLRQGQVEEAKELVRQLPLARPGRYDFDTENLSLISDYCAALPSIPYTDSEFVRTLSDGLLMLDCFTQEFLPNRLFEQVFRSERLPVPILRRLATKHIIWAHQWQYLTQRMLLPQRTLQAGDAIPFGLYAMLQQREQRLRAALTAALSVDLAGYILAAI